MSHDHGGDSHDNRTPAIRAMVRLGVLGLVPLVVLAVWLAAIAPDHPWRAGTIRLLATYAAVVLSFLAGIRWGLAIARPGEADDRVPALAIVPVLIAWLAILLPPPSVFAVLAVAFAGHGAWDSFAAGSGAAPPWYGRLRIWLTLAAVAVMIVAFLATSGRFGAQAGTSLAPAIG